MKAIDIHNSNSLKILIFNVGQGDHFLIKFPDSSYGLIDFHYAGKKKDLYSQMEPPVLEYFRQLKYELEDDLSQIKIRFVHLSHSHLDHIKGCSKVLEFFRFSKVKIENILLPATETAETYLQVLQKISDDLGVEETSYKVANNHWSKELRSLEDFHIDKSKPEYESVFDVHKYIDWSVDEDDLVVMSYGPTEKRLKKVKIGEVSQAMKMVLSRVTDKMTGNSDLGGLSDSETKFVHSNLLSSLLWIKWKDHSVLFTGDIEKATWLDSNKNFDKKKYTKQYGPLDFNFIKLSHHGSRYVSNEEIWSRLVDSSDCNFVASAGYNLKYNHPNSETIEDLKRASDDFAVNSTNICRLCLEKFDNEEFILNYSSRINYSDADLAGGINLNNSDKTESKLGLFAIVYDLSFDGEIVKSFLTSKGTPTIDTCFFRGHKASPDNCQRVYRPSERSD